MEKPRHHFQEILLYIAALCGFCSGILFFLPPAGNALNDRFHSSIFCAFPGKATAGAFGLCYLLLCLPMLLLFICSFSRLALPGCLFCLTTKGLLSGYACRAMLHFHGNGSAGILCYLLYLLSEGEIWLLTLAIARACYTGSCGLRGDHAVAAGHTALDLLFCCGLMLPVLLLRGLCCGVLLKC